MADFSITFVEDVPFGVSSAESGFDVSFAEENFSVAFIEDNSFSITFGDAGPQGPRGGHGTIEVQYIVDDRFDEPNLTVGDPSTPGTVTLDDGSMVVAPWITDPQGATDYYQAIRGSHIDRNTGEVVPNQDWSVVYVGVTDTEIDNGITRFIAANPDVIGSTAVSVQVVNGTPTTLREGTIWLNSDPDVNAIQYYDGTTTFTLPTHADNVTAGDVIGFHEDDQEFRGLVTRVFDNTDIIVNNPADTSLPSTFSFPSTLPLSPAEIAIRANNEIRTDAEADAAFLPHTRILVILTVGTDTYRLIAEETTSNTYTLVDGFSGSTLDIIRFPVSGTVTATVAELFDVVNVISGIYFSNTAYLLGDVVTQSYSTSLTINGSSTQIAFSRDFIAQRTLTADDHLPPLTAYTQADVDAGRATAMQLGQVNFDMWGFEALNLTIPFDLDLTDNSLFSDTTIFQNGDIIRYVSQSDGSNRAYLWLNDTFTLRGNAAALAGKQNTITAFSSTATYAIGDIVFISDGELYRNLTGTAGTDPAADGTNWMLVGGGSAGGVEILADDPASPFEGQAWFNSTDDVLRYYDGTDTQTVVDRSYYNANTGITVHHAVSGTPVNADFSGESGVGRSGSLTIVNPGDYTIAVSIEITQIISSYAQGQWRVTLVDADGMSVASRNISETSDDGDTTKNLVANGLTAQTYALNVTLTNHNNVQDWLVQARASINDHDSVDVDPLVYEDLDARYLQSDDLTAVDTSITNLNTEVWGSDIQTGDSRIDTAEAEIDALDAEVQQLASTSHSVQVLSDVGNIDTIHEFATERFTPVDTTNNNILLGADDVDGSTIVVARFFTGDTEVHILTSTDASVIELGQEVHVFASTGEIGHFTTSVLDGETTHVISHGSGEGQFWEVTGIPTQTLLQNVVDNATDRFSDQLDVGIRNAYFLMSDELSPVTDADTGALTAAISNNQLVLTWATAVPSTSYLPADLFTFTHSVDAVTSPIEFSSADVTVDAAARTWSIAFTGTDQALPDAAVVRAGLTITDYAVRENESLNYITGNNYLGSNTPALGVDDEFLRRDDVQGIANAGDTEINDRINAIIAASHHEWHGDIFGADFTNTNLTTIQVGPEVVADDDVTLDDDNDTFTINRDGIHYFTVSGATVSTIVTQTGTQTLTPGLYDASDDSLVVAFSTVTLVRDDIVVGPEVIINETVSANIISGTELYLAGVGAVTDNPGGFLPGVRLRILGGDLRITTTQEGIGGGGGFDDGQIVRLGNGSTIGAEGSAVAIATIDNVRSDEDIQGVALEYFRDTPRVINRGTVLGTDVTNVAIGRNDTIDIFDSIPAAIDGTGAATRQLVYTVSDGTYAWVDATSGGTTNINVAAFETIDSLSDRTTEEGVYYQGRLRRVITGSTTVYDIRVLRGVLATGVITTFQDDTNTVEATAQAEFDAIVADPTSVTYT